MACHSIISDNEIENIYKIPIIEDISLSSQCVTDDTKKVEIDLFKDGTFMTDSKIDRLYHKEEALKSFDGVGKVAEHKLFVLSESYRGKGIAKLIHEKELDIYKNHEFVEIHLCAAWDGWGVWKSFGFEYEDAGRIEPIIYKYWTKFFLESFVSMDLVEEAKYAIIGKQDRLSNVLKKYQKGFGTWLYKNKINNCVKMYKRIDS